MKQNQCQPIANVKIILEETSTAYLFSNYLENSHMIQM